MTIIDVQIYYPSRITPDTGVLVPQTVSAFDLRKVIFWNDWTTVGSTTTVQVAIDPSGTSRQIWPKVEFEAAKVLSLNAEAATGD